MRCQVEQVLHATATANELGNGRGVPIGIRRAVRGLADAIRRELDPRDAGGACTRLPHAFSQCPGDRSAG
jgi:hypothetical protein